MGEKEPIKSARKSVDPLSGIAPPLGGPDVLIDRVLIYQGATPTDTNRENLRAKIGHMSAHRS